MADDTSYVNQHNGEYLVVTAILFLALSWLSVVLRTYVRAFMTNAFELDDWLMLTAQSNFTLSCGFILVGVNHGLGRHNSALSQEQEIQALKWQALATATYITNMMFIKLSIGVFLLRLASQRRFKWIIWVSMGIIFIMSSVLFFWDVFQCKPVAAQWDTTIPDYQCVSASSIVDAAYALSVLNIVTDWLYALLPIPMIWKAKMTAQAKITVALVLSLGIFASVATLIRVKFLADLNDVDDILYAGTEAMIWTLIEPGVAIVAASLVTIRPLLRQMRLRGFESSERSRSLKIFNRYNRSRGTAEVLDDDEERLDVVGNGWKLKDGAKQKGVKMTTIANVKLKDLENGQLDYQSSQSASCLAAEGFAGMDRDDMAVLSRTLTLVNSGAVAGIGVAVTVNPDYNESEEEERQEFDNDENGGSTISKSHQMTRIKTSGIQEASNRPRTQTATASPTPIPTTASTTAATETMVWRSETPSSPSSPEESDVIQGLRYPDRRDITTRQLPLR